MSAFRTKVYLAAVLGTRQAFRRFVFTFGAGIELSEVEQAPKRWNGRLTVRNEGNEPDKYPVGGREM